MDFPRSATPPVHELVDRHVAATPDTVAVSDEEGSWTYRQLSDRADALAVALAPHVRPGDRVAVHVGRRMNLVAAALAVLRSGAVYVPLDPEYPADRLRFVAEDAGPAAVVSDDPGTAAAWGAPVIPADADAQGPFERPVTAPDGAAYVIYTSGSTGRPKGAVLAHRSVGNILEHAADSFGFGPGDSVLALASVAFDFAVLEMFLPLTAGGTLHLPPRAVARDPELLSRWIEERDITFLMGTPSMFGAMLGAGWHPRPGMTLIAGGEVLPPATARGLTADCTLWNIYGPTETTIYATCEKVDPDDITIGRPARGVTLAVLDGDRPVGPGEAGELCVKGIGVALGYHRRPDLTRERFGRLPDDPDTPCYRTGDLVRMRPDGRVDYLGRIDDQVKIRGFRVELGGIEEAIRAEPGVQEAAVVLAGPADSPVLAAHVVFTGGSDVRTLRENLRRRLPAHEVPHHLFAAAALPRSPHGKVDRAALRELPLPGAHDPAPAAADSDIAALLREIFGDVLGRSDIRDTDAFFDMGGDSLSALRIVSRARAAGVALSVRDLTDLPTVAALARHLGTDAPGEAAPEATDETVRVLPSQGWFFGIRLPHRAHFVEPITLEAEKRVDRDRLQAALDALARRHPGLMSRFDGDTVRAVHTPFPLLESELGPEHDGFEAALDGLYARVDLAEGPVSLAALFRGGARDVLLLAFHHLVVDALSMQVIAQELDRLYADGPHALDKPPVSALRHSATLTSFARSAAARQAEREWLALPWSEVGEVPHTGPLTGHVQADLSSTDLVLEPQLAERVRSVANHSPVSTEELILAGVAEGLAACGSSPTVSFDLFRHGRWPRPGAGDISSTVGWLAEVVPHVLTTPLDAGPLGRLASLRAQVLRLRSFEETWGPLRHSSADPQVRARMAALPRPQVFLHYQGRGLTDLPPMAAFTPVTTRLGLPKSPLKEPFRPIELRVNLEGGKVGFNWRLAEAAYAPGTAEALAHACADAIARLTDAVVPASR
ncbi:amino acid adenylation domain-containing protein [Streptomyces sp. NPDC096198]|uniref:amino acid adenylation domain-containing protein n=1 Tax=Streptomyces sp. NPDC096198 TaxID=3366080 RepID=UPI00381A8078